MIVAITEETNAAAEEIPALEITTAVCGLSFFCSSAAETAVDSDTAAAITAVMTTVCGLFFFCSAAVAAVILSAANLQFRAGDI